MLFNQLSESDVGSSSFCPSMVAGSEMLLNHAAHGKSILICPHLNRSNGRHSPLFAANSSNSA